MAEREEDLGWNYQGRQAAIRSVIDVQRLYRGRMLADHSRKSSAYALAELLCQVVTVEIVRR